MWVSHDSSAKVACSLEGISLGYCGCQPSPVISKTWWRWRMHQKEADTEFCHLLWSKKRDRRTRDASKAGRSFISETYLGKRSSRRLGRQKQQEGSVGEQNGVVEQPLEIRLQINTKTWGKVSLVITTARLQLCKQMNTHLMWWMILEENIIKQDLVDYQYGQPSKLQVHGVSGVNCMWPQIFEKSDLPHGNSAVQSLPKAQRKAYK